MTHEVRSDKERAFAFVSAKVPITRTPNQTGIVQLRNGEIIAAVVYDEFNGHNVFIHCASSGDRRWLNRWFLHETFKHPFITLGCTRITAWVEDTNSDSKKFIEHIGFSREAVLKGAGSSGQDVILYVMRREDCRHA